MRDWQRAQAIMRGSGRGLPEIKRVLCGRACVTNPRRLPRLCWGLAAHANAIGEFFE